MKFLSVVLFTVVVVPLWDWLGVTRMGAYATSFDYRYWLLSKARWISVFLLAFTVAGMGFFGQPTSAAPLWPLVVMVLAIANWAYVAGRDVLLQKRVGYRIPPDYGDRETE
ncbi:hypothetical protein EJC47_13300 [Sphingomonas sp. TF3]|uniref:hypothetical protein n=1 Tax=Sphingomonas sp. TF3 TaxID=2495580 RepID=UPI000F880AFF|nr:hypothetical protein [Sphingomonas sp. TF3]RUN76096.1 hypothetical protein EJC47_13300 [Sphingomonas sp. TF3]